MTIKLNQVNKTAERVAKMTFAMTACYEGDETMSSEYLSDLRARRILETMCDKYHDEGRVVWGKYIAPCYERCSLMVGKPDCKHNWAR